MLKEGIFFQEEREFVHCSLSLSMKLRNLVILTNIIQMNWILVNTKWRLNIQQNII